MTIKGVMFDFSQTLFRIKDAGAWLRGALDAVGTTAVDGEVAACAARLERVGALPGGPCPERIPEHLVRLWHERDLDAQCHRAAYTGLAREAALPWPDLVDVLYERHMSPSMWQPYPDAREVLEGLRRSGVPVAVVSNVGWDLRPIFRAHDLERLVDTFVLSFEHRKQKPDPALFRLACEAIGVPPRDALMVGDDRTADAGAAALGCRVRLVDPLPVLERPTALLGVLDLVGRPGDRRAADKS